MRLVILQYLLKTKIWSNKNVIVINSIIGRVKNLFLIIWGRYVQEFLKKTSQKAICPESVFEFHDDFFWKSGKIVLESPGLSLN